MHEFHFLRPVWFSMIFPLVFLGYHLWKQKPALQSWLRVCDPILLRYLLKTNQTGSRPWPRLLLMISGLCMIVALAGPTWSRLPVPTYQSLKPHLILLDLSEDMLQEDLKPSRLARAKFKIHDLMQHRDKGQFGLIVYTSEPFVVSPLTDDGQTIDALLPALSPTLMPVQGNHLELALNEVDPLVKASGAAAGEVLVLTGKIPSHVAVDEAKQLASKGLHVSVIPMLADNKAIPLFAPLAQAGQGEVIPFSHTNQDIDQWLSVQRIATTYQTKALEDVPLWYDEGRWFLLAGLILLLPIFRRGWFQRLLG